MMEDNNMNQTTTAPTPAKRVKRTVVQVVLATAAAVPTAWLALTAAGVEVSPRVTALVLGIPAALYVLVSAAQNAYDQLHGEG